MDFSIPVLLGQTTPPYCGANGELTVLPPGKSSSFTLSAHCGEGGGIHFSSDYPEVI